MAINLIQICILYFFRFFGVIEIGMKNFCLQVKLLFIVLIMLDHLNIFPFLNILLNLLRDWFSGSVCHERGWSFPISLNPRKQKRSVRF